MRITYGAVELASDNLALGRVGPAGVVLNGVQVVDPAEIFRAATTTYYGRGNRSVALSFAVLRFFATEAAAARFIATHHNDLEDEGDLLLTQDDETLSLPGAVLEAVGFDGWAGCGVRVTYTLRGSAFEAGASPLPEPDPSMTRHGLADVDADATTVDVVFSSPLPGVPFVPGAVLMMPTAGGDVIFASPIEDTITAAGLTFSLSGPPSGAGYKLPYQAYYTAP
jgi:hypothetical protein